MYVVSAESLILVISTHLVGLQLPHFIPFSNWTLYSLQDTKTLFTETLRSFDNIKIVCIFYYTCSVKREWLSIPSS